jgi:hypothetical protein
MDHRSRTPIIVFSATPVEAEALKAGVDEFSLKPQGTSLLVGAEMQRRWTSHAASMADHSRYWGANPGASGAARVVTRTLRDVKSQQ